MADVVDFAAAKAEREPHWSGPCVCLGCRHEWVGCGPIGTTTGLECPDCSVPKGVIKYLFGAQPGDMQLSCHCACEALTAYQRSSDRLWFVRCMACGNDLTRVFFEGN